MKILAPVNNLKEADALIKAGADELYCGFLPQQWLRRYSNVASLNRREWKSANISSRESFSAIVSLAKTKNVPVYVALNALYTKKQYPVVLDQVDFFRYSGIGGIIVADLGLMAGLKKKIPDIDIHVSTGGTTFNSQTAMFYRDLGAKRIVLPRQIRIDEAKEIIKKCPGVQFEMFILNSGCKNIDGFCTFHHGIKELNNSRLWGIPKKLNLDSALLESLRRLPDGILRQIRSNILGIDSACLINYSVRLSSSDHPASRELEKSLLKNISSAFYLYTGMDPCGACRIAELSKIGIFGLKIVGRNFSMAKKIKDVNFVKGLLDNLKDHPAGPGWVKKAKESYRMVYKTDCKNICYYPYENNSY